ncbi:MAG: DeoR/GlpR family DNA-binding transcription regulator [Firmicutes bacterium]|nr:DeoR/GlpR family DNA-binding transcription regulator [Bacillota bacterium]
MVCGLWFVVVQDLLVQVFKDVEPGKVPKRVGERMFAEERYQMILSYLKAHKNATTTQLCELLGTSETTLRRDIGYLQETNAIIKVFGGVMLAKTTATTKVHEENIVYRRGLECEKKRAIAKKAVQYIGNDDFVFLDAGSSTEILADLTLAKGAVYVTNSIVCAGKLSAKGCEVHILGGSIKPRTEAIIGIEAVSVLARYNFTKAFLGVNGVDVEGGLTTPDVEEAKIKDACIERAQKSFVLADSSKFGLVAPVCFGRKRSVGIFTDKRPGKAFVDNFEIIVAE